MGWPAKVSIGVLVFVVVPILARHLVLIPLLRAKLMVKRAGDGPEDWRDRVEMRFQAQHISVWMFAWCKLRADAMFREIPAFLRGLPTFSTALDLGCGHGIAGASLLEWIPGLRLYGIDPSPRRVRSANRVFGDRGVALRGLAPDFETPELPSRIDAVLCLDVIHFLSDEQLDLTLRRIHGRLVPGGTLLLRAPVLPQGAGSPVWKVSQVARRLTRTYACHRNVEQIRDAISSAGFEIGVCQMSGGNPELHWFIAVAEAGARRR